MAYRRSIYAKEDETAKINLSPMIDCIFILLIFFIVTTVFVEKPDATIEKPFALTDSNLEKNSLILACLLYTSPSPRDVEESRMPSSA